MDAAQLPLPLFLFFMSEIILALVVVFYMFNYLKRMHPETWAQIGSPSFLNNSIKNNFLFIGFMFRRKYLTLGDPKLNQLCLLIWALHAIALILFLIVESRIFFPSHA